MTDLDAMRTCSLDGCFRPHYAKGYCNPHWRRWKRNGHPGPSTVKSRRPGLCPFPGCGRPKSCLGLCATHYAQHRRGHALTPINDRVPARMRDSEGRKRCSTCKGWLPIDQFRVHSRRPDGLMGACIRCMRHRVVVRRYGMSIDAYERLSSVQGGVCAICRTVGGRRSLAVDHHHGTGEVRGLLCGSCNAGLGQFKEDPALLRAAIAYLAAGGVDVGD